MEIRAAVLDTLGETLLAIIALPFLEAPQTPPARKGCPTSEQGTIRLKQFLNNLPFSSQSAQIAMPILSLSDCCHWQLPHSKKLHHQLFLIYPFCPSISTGYLSIHPSPRLQNLLVCWNAKITHLRSAHTPGRFP